jgi:hypothetical protein
MRHNRVSGEPSHFGSAAHPAGSVRPSTGAVSIGSGKDHVIGDAFHTGRRQHGARSPGRVPVPESCGVRG